jgi:hypothetical protein
MIFASSLGSFKGVLEILPDERLQAFVAGGHAISSPCAWPVHHALEILPGRCLAIECEGKNLNSDFAGQKNRASRIAVRGKI